VPFARATLARGPVSRGDGVGETNTTRPVLSRFSAAPFDFYGRSGSQAVFAAGRHQTCTEVSSRSTLSAFWLGGSRKMRLPATLSDRISPVSCILKWLTHVRRAEPSDSAFLVAMARLACTLADRPLPGADDPEVLAVLPGDADAALVAVDDGQPVGAAWWHLHAPPLLRDQHRRALVILVGWIRRAVGSPRLPGIKPRQIPAMERCTHCFIDQALELGIGRRWTTGRLTYHKDWNTIADGVRERTTAAVHVAVSCVDKGCAALRAAKEAD
jgi:hypothetical protein